MHLVMNAFALTGAVVVAYGGAVVVCTVVDIFQRWRRSRAGDVNAWKAYEFQGAWQRAPYFLPETT